MAKSRSREGSKRNTSKVDRIFKQILIGEEPERKELKQFYRVLDSKELWDILPADKSHLLLNLKIHKNEKRYAVPEIIEKIVNGIVAQCKESEDLAGTISRIHLFPKDYKKSILPDLFDVIDRQENQQLFAKLFELSCDSLKYIDDQGVDKINACYIQFFTDYDYRRSPMFRALKIKDIDQNILLQACTRLINSHYKLNRFLREMSRLTLNARLDHHVLPSAFVALYSDRDNKNTIDDFLMQKREYELRKNGKSKSRKYTFDVALRKVLGLKTACEVMLPMVRSGMFAGINFPSEVKNQLFEEITTQNADEKQTCLQQIGNVNTHLGRAYSSKSNFLLFKGKRTKSTRFVRKAKLELAIEDAANKAIEQINDQVEAKMSTEPSMTESQTSRLSRSF